jgi:hypothetical protein
MPWLIDLTGQRFGRLVALCRQSPYRTKDIRWLCQCDCGEQRSVVGASLRRGLQKSCGCLRREIIAAVSRERPLHDLTGRRFGRLIVVSLAPKRGGNRSWLCRCDCGRETAVFARSLLSGVSGSCGCGSPYRKKHGLSRTKAYKASHASLRRARKRYSQVEPINLLDILVRDGWRCYICGIETPEHLRRY